MPLEMTQAMSADATGGTPEGLARKRERTDGSGDNAGGGADVASAHVMASAPIPFPVLQWRGEADRDKSRRFYSDITGTPIDDEDEDFEAEFAKLLPSSTDVGGLTTCLDSNPVNCPDWVLSCCLPEVWANAAAKLVPCESVSTVANMARIWYGVCTWCNPQVTQEKCLQWVTAQTTKKLPARIQELLRAAMFNELDVRMHETCVAHESVVRDRHQTDLRPQMLNNDRDEFDDHFTLLAHNVNDLSLREEQRVAKLHENTVQLAEAIALMRTVEQRLSRMETHIDSILERLPPAKGSFGGGASGGGGRGR
jgi:hypothetical protein